MSKVEAWSKPLQFDRIVVTGAGSGIGRAVALKLARCGVTTYVFGRRLYKLEETAELAKDTAGRIVPISTDCADPKKIDAAFKEVEAHGGPVGGLIHAASEATFMAVKDMPPEEFEYIVAQTLFSGFHTIHRWALALMEKDLPGSAVVMTSGGAYRGVPGVAHSSAGKAGLESFCRAVAREWGPKNIRLNIIGPGVFPVENSQDMWADPEVKARTLKQIALNRYGVLDDMIGPTLFFMSEDSSYVTGQTILVDGGVGLYHWAIEPEEINRGLNNRNPPRA